MSAIVDIIGREIIDSRGNPTVECDVLLESGVMGRAGAPPGAPPGTREALELRDGDKARYGGKGVRTAVSNVNGEIARVVIGIPPDPRVVDAAMIALDGTPNKGRLGANAILGVSMAVAHAAAAEKGQPHHQFLRTLVGADAPPAALPVPLMNILN